MLACIKHGWLVTYHGTVADGSRCNNRPESFDVCIDGKCRVSKNASIRSKSVKHLCNPSKPPYWIEQIFSEEVYRELARLKAIIIILKISNKINFSVNVKFV